MGSTERSNFGSVGPGVPHTSDGAEVICHVPGKNKKEKTINAYVLTGAASLLSSGEPTFTDKSAREVCSDAGCYDANNHAHNLDGKGNLFSGSKKTGWTLTAPGLTHAATL